MKRVYVLGFVDALAFSLFTGLISTGGLLLLKLPPGSGQRFSVLGLARHQWGDIHSVIAGLFLLVLLVHITMHYKWIVALIQGSDPAQRTRRMLTAITIITVVSLVFLLPLMVSVDVAGR